MRTEFVENPGEHPTKQDCELKAFYRLTERLKQRFPRLPFGLLLDGLFAGGPTFARCQDNGWKYLIVLQEGDLPSVQQEFAALTKLAPENHLRFHTGRQAEIHQDFRWANDIAYVDSERREHTVAVLECLETKPQDGQPVTTRFKWISNFNPLANEGGRLRWKIENEGFNIQKNGGFRLEHAYSQNATAAKIFYFLLQIAHLLVQLVEHGTRSGSAALFPKAWAWPRTLRSDCLKRGATLGGPLSDSLRHLLTSEAVSVVCPPLTVGLHVQ